LQGWHTKLPEGTPFPRDGIQTLLRAELLAGTQLTPVEPKHKKESVKSYQKAKARMREWPKGDKETPEFLQSAYVSRKERYKSLYEMEHNLFQHDDSGVEEIANSFVLKKDQLGSLHEHRHAGGLQHVACRPGCKNMALASGYQVLYGVSVGTDRNSYADVLTEAMTFPVPEGETDKEGWKQAKKQKTAKKLEQRTLIFDFAGQKISGVAMMPDCKGVFVSAGGNVYSIFEHGPKEEAERKGKNGEDLPKDLSRIRQPRISSAELPGIVQGSGLFLDPKRCNTGTRKIHNSLGENMFGKSNLGNCNHFVLGARLGQTRSFRFSSAGEGMRMKGGLISLKLEAANEHPNQKVRQNSE
jgi:hypothetical protein